MDIEKCFAIAARIGIRRPAYTQTDRPQLFECWRDRMLLAVSQFQRGADAAAMIREAQIYGGHPPPSIAEAKHAQANARLIDFFDYVVPRVLVEVSEPEDAARRRRLPRHMSRLIH